MRSPRERAFAEAAQLNARNQRVTVRAIRENAGVSQAIAQEAAKAFSVTRDQVDAGREVPEPLVALTRSLFNDLAAEAFSIYGHKIDERETEIQQLVSDNDVLNGDIADLRQNLKQLTETHDAQRSLLDKTRGELDVQASLRIQAESEILLVRNQLAECQALLVDLQAQLHATQKRHAVAVHENEVLEQQNNALRDAVVAAAVRPVNQTP